MMNYASKYIGQIVEVKIDRPLHSKHPQHDLIYEVNYGYIEDTKAPDGEEVDAYVLGINKPIKQFRGKCIAIIHRLDDDDDKLIVVPEGETISDEELEKMVKFQEKWFKHEIIR